MKRKEYRKEGKVSEIMLSTKKNLKYGKERKVWKRI